MSRKRKPAAKPAPRPAAKPAPRPAAKPAPRPAAKPAPRPAAKPAPRPAAKPAPRPAAKPAPRPAAKPAPRPAAKPAPRPAAKPAPRPAAKPAPLLDDPFDITPTPDIPGVYLGIYKGIRNRCAIAYKRDDRNVWTVMFSENGGTRVLVKWGAADFDANMRHAPVPLNTHARRYPLGHAIDVFLKPGAVYEQTAYKVLTKLRKGQDPTEEDSLDELLDTTPSVAPMRARRTRTFGQKQERRAQRQAKLAAMTPAELRAFRDKRNARRRMRRANAKKQSVVTKKGGRK